MPTRLTYGFIHSFVIFLQLRLCKGLKIIVNNPLKTSDGDIVESCEMEEKPFAQLDIKPFAEYCSLEMLDAGAGAGRDLLPELNATWRPINHFKHGGEFDWMK